MIKYASIINSFVSTEGSSGFMTNYIYYSVLVAYSDGSKKIVEGKLREISFLLDYVRTPMDEMMEMEETVKKLREDLNDILEQKVGYIINSLYPIPNIMGENEVTAADKLREAGLIPVFVNKYPEGTPPIGKVYECFRDNNNFKLIHLKVIRNCPNVIGMKTEKALKLLKEAGFSSTINHYATTRNEDDTVLECTRGDESKLNVSLVISRAIPNLSGMRAGDAVKMMPKDILVDIVREYNDQYLPGTVIRWEAQLGKVILFVSTTSFYTAKHVSMIWSTMIDSSGDQYEATAQFDNRSLTLFIELSYSLGTKWDHSITQVFCEQGLSAFNPSFQPNLMGASSKGKATITFPIGRPFESLPKQMSFILNTKYGTMNTVDPVNLSFEFEW